MRLLTCVTTLGLLALITGWFLWIVRRRAGLLESKKEQSWLAVSASAIRKPLALFVWVVGGAFALMPIVNGIASRPTRIFGPAHSPELFTPARSSLFSGSCSARFLRLKNECTFGPSAPTACSAK